MGGGRDEVTEALRDEGVDASRLWFRGDGVVEGNAEC